MAPSSKTTKRQSSHADQKSVTDTRCFPPPTRSLRLDWSNEAKFRKLRNRISQRAFRARQSGYIKELEEKLQRAEKPDLNINKLEEENQRLRVQLLNCHKKLENLIVSMKTVSASLSEATTIEPFNKETPGNRNSSDGSSSPGVDPLNTTLAGDVAGWEMDNILQYQVYSIPSQNPIILNQEEPEPHP
ncbi:unnamed protein product [Penicillium pancosmium]